jgi:hypothetical protein
MSCLCQLDTAVETAKQRHAEMVPQRLDLSADRPWARCSAAAATPKLGRAAAISKPQAPGGAEVGVASAAFE